MSGGITSHNSPQVDILLNSFCFSTKMNATERIKVFRLKELKSATKNFSKFLGKGGYGSVYRADFPNGTSLAAKKLDGLSKQGDVEFIREVELLSRLHHRHLVDLVGFCAERNERILVYEFMAMGSLYHHLHGTIISPF